VNLSTLNPNELVGPSGRNVQSAYFGGTGDYLSRAFTSTTDGMYPQGTTYTIEAWFYASLTTNVRIIYDCSASNVASFGGVWLGMNAGAAQFNCRPTTGGTLTSISGGSIVTNSWNHIAISVNAGSGRLFLNGTQVGSTTTISACSFTPVGASIGRLSNGYTVGTPDYAGYISNVRLVQSTAIYTANFTPPTAPLTAITNTSFLLGFSEYQFIDQSPNNFTIARNGNTTQSTFSPYGDNWSNFFDGTGDYLTVGGGLPSGQGTAFTLECWIWVNNLTNYAAITRGATTSTFDFGISPAGALSLDNTGVINICASANGVILANTWHHVAITRSTGNIYKLWVDGTNVATSSAYTTSMTANTTIGYSSFSASQYFRGYVSNFRVVSSEVYTSAFTPPTAPLAAITNTSLLTCQSNRFRDASTNNFSITRNGDVSVQYFSPFSGPVPEPAVDVYTTTGVANTWTKRPGAKAVQMIAIGAGGGGGGGGTGTAGTFRNGGSGGGGGANGQIIYTADQLPATLYIRVGASGTAGVSNGAGGAGGNSTIAAADPITSSTSVYCMGGGGGGGKQGGQATEGGGGGGGGTAGAGTTGTGASAVNGGLPSLGGSDLIAGGGGVGGYSNTTAPGRAEWGGGGGGCARQAGDFRFDGAGSLYGGGGGGCGSALNTGGGANGGTSGGLSGHYALSGGGAGGVVNSNGGAGPNASGVYAAGGGGGGGYVNNTGTGYLGGAGGFPGGGGGGGGAGSSAGGTGGVGGAGRVVVVTFF
jgi:hypothetical protein